MKKISILLFFLFSASFIYCAEQSCKQKLAIAYDGVLTHIGFAKTELLKAKFVNERDEEVESGISSLDELKNTYLERKRYFLEEEYDEVVLSDELKNIHRIKESIDPALRYFQGLLSRILK